jgi:phosphoglycerate kinase
VTIRSIEELDLAGARVLIRVDFNTPLRDGEISDDTRIRAALPTIRHAIEHDARVVLMSHLGRPKGAPEDRYSLLPVAQRLAELLEGEVHFTDDCIGPGVRKVVGERREGEVVLLENLRFRAGEKKNDPVFAERLAASGDVYINDAFGALHRAHASTVGVPALIENRAMGLLVLREVKALGKLLQSPPRPFVAILGGAKVSDKIGVFDNLTGKVDSFIVGGAMAFTFLAAKGLPVGDSLVEKDKIWQAKRIIDRTAERGVQLHLPTDFVVTTSPDGSSSHETVTKIPDGTMGVDIGPASVDAFAEVLADAETVFWNGPMGIFEVPQFAAGTQGVAQAVAGSNAYSVVGGGDSVAALRQLGMVDQVGHASTGGGASLEFLSGTQLPGLAALDRS